MRHQGGKKSVHSSLQLDVETFRNLALEELNGREYLAGWLEGKWLQKTIGSSSDRQPITPKGREFVDFYETFYHVLHWYRPKKMRVFDDLVWKIDEQVVENIKQKFALLIRHALEIKEKDVYDNWFRSYDLEDICRYTAADWKLQNICGHSVEHILDFGSGVGRQAFQ